MTNASLLIPAAILLSLPIVATRSMMQQAATAPAPAVNTARLSPEAAAKAKHLYGMECALCHNDNGDGKADLARDMKLTMPDMTAYGALNAMSDQEIFNLIRTGKDKMPAETPDRAKDAEIRNLVIYIRSFAANTPPAAPAATPVTAPVPKAAPVPAALPAGSGN